jgi:hypothetical protein
MPFESISEDADCVSMTLQAIFALRFAPAHRFIGYQLRHKARDQNTCRGSMRWPEISGRPHLGHPQHRLLDILQDVAAHVEFESKQSKQFIIL